MKSNRNQKILTFPDYLSTICMSPNQQYLVIGSATYNQDVISNIYVVDTVGFKVVRKLQFHTKGVQGLKFSSCGAYLISIGNHRENTLAVWDFLTGRLLTSTYTVNTLNDLTIKSQDLIYSENILEFCTGGHNIITFWQTTPDNILTANDIKVSSNDTEISSVEFCYPSAQQTFVLVGMTNGNVICVNVLWF